ncbi:MAG: efflux RND transporter periplasmic adaptor subunit, partial [candidate division WOR-3 bacterium]
GVRLTLERRAGVPAVPLSALFADGGGRVLVVADSVARLRDIVVGLKGDELVEVRSGLAEGELVVTTGKERIRDGERVNAVPGGLR